MRVAGRVLAVSLGVSLAVSLAGCGRADEGGSTRAFMDDRCGTDIATLLSRDDRLAMTASFPADAELGQVEVVNRSVSAVRGTTASSPDLFAVRDGKVVAVPGARDESARLLDLAPGQSVTYGVTRPVSCETGEFVGPGRYDVYGVLLVTQPDGTQFTASGGPWPLEFL